MKIARERMEMRDMVAELCAIVKNYLSMERSEMLVNYMKFNKQVANCLLLGSELHAIYF